MPTYVSIRQHAPAYVSIRQHAPAYVSIRQHTSGGARDFEAELAGQVGLEEALESGSETHAGLLWAQSVTTLPLRLIFRPPLPSLVSGRMHATSLSPSLAISRARVKKCHLSCVLSRSRSLSLALSLALFLSLSLSLALSLSLSSSSSSAASSSCARHVSVLTV